MEAEQAVSAEWYVRRAGQMRGPLPSGRLSREILLGRVLASDELSLDRNRWQTLAVLPELVPPVLRNVDTEAGRQRLLLARLRVDERTRDRRRARARTLVERRRTERRQTALFEVVSPPMAEIVPPATADDSLVLVALAIGMLLLFAAVLYLLW